MTTEREPITQEQRDRINERRKASDLEPLGPDEQPSEEELDEASD